MKPNNQFTDWPKFAVMDIEATQWVNVVCICHMDEFGNKIHFRTIAEYLDWLFSPAFKGEFVWAHWGGHYDTRFILADLFKRQWGFETVQSGNLIVVLSARGKSSSGKHRIIRFCESARLMPDSVEAIGKSLDPKGDRNLRKLDADRTNIEGLTWDEVLTYCYRDCEIVLEGLKEMRKNLMSVDMDFAFTLASITTRYVRRSGVLNPWRFYHKNRETGKAEMSPVFVEADEWSAPAYFGGRVEVFKMSTRECPVFRDLYYYDITSSYPYSMLHELPAYFQEFKAPYHKRNGEIDIERSLMRCGITEAIVTVPYGSMYLPILPIRDHGKILFPTLHDYMGRWTNLELLALWQRMKHVRGFKLQLLRQTVYEPVKFLKPFVELFWGLRLKAIEANDNFKKYTYKIALNSCSGKLAENAEKESFIFGADEYNRAVEKHGLSSIYSSKIPGIYLVKHEMRGPFRHAAAAAYITARSRLLLLEGMETCRKAGGQVYYCDTDSIMTDVPALESPKEKRLGAWNLEYTIAEAEIFAPKNYKIVLKPGTYKEDDVPHGVIYRAKGMPISRREDRARPDVTEQRWQQYTAFHKDLDLPKPTKEGIQGTKTDFLIKGNLYPVAFELARTVQAVDNKRQHFRGDSQPVHINEVVSGSARKARGLH